MSDKSIKINVPVLARVEGEGALELSIQDGKITHLKLRIYEPPRYFEKFLERRSYQDLADTVARICGICPVAYQMSAVHAIESIFHTQTTAWIRALRRVFYCGEWIQSHALHIHMLAAPDFLGCQSIIELAQKEDEAVRRGLRLQALGNELITLLGGRSVHPVGAKVGGFYHAPNSQQVAKLIPQLEQGWLDSEALILWLDTLELPNDTQPFTCVAMRHPDEYPMNEGRIVSDSGLDISIDEYQQHFKEHHAPHSTALHSLLEGEPYLLGPLARLNLNQDRLSDEVLAPLAQTQYHFPSHNMYHSMVARAVEIRFAIGEALKILRKYQPPEQPSVEITPQAGIGFGCSEAPRGLLWHRYEVDSQGEIVNAIIVPPTSQNQARIEQDIARSLEKYGLDHSESELRFYAERVVRNYDPCISCATHFLTLTVQRSKQESISPLESKTGILLLAIGSPFGSDSVAWQVAEQLQKQNNIQIIYSSNPLVQLKPLLETSKQVILLDALISEQPIGQLIPITLEQQPVQHPQSSHSLTTRELLALLQTLKKEGQTCQLIGISVGDGDQPITQKQIAVVGEQLKLIIEKGLKVE